MNEAIKHAKVTQTVPIAPDTSEIYTDSYYEQLAHAKTEVEKFKMCPKQDILKELIDTAGLFNDGSPEVTITLKRTGTPNIVKVTKRWVATNESFNRK